MKRLFALLTLPMLVLAACTSVDSTEHCIETRYGKVVNERMSEGIHPTITTTATCFSLTDQNYPSAQGDKETMEAQTKEPVTVSSDVAIVYAYDPATIVSVFKEKRSPQAVQVEVINAIRDGYRSALAGWTLEDIFSDKRAYLADSVRAHIQRKLGHRAVIKNVFVRDIRVPPQIEQARIAAAKQQQELDKAQKEQAIAEAEAKAEVARAQGEAEANRLRAQSYSSNPKLLDLEISKETAKICQGTQTCVIGGSVADTWKLGGR